MRGPLFFILVTASLLSACASEAPVDTTPSGAPTIQAETVREHAQQFAEDVPVREPGSQEELAAASYILGHLQQAGYVPLLDPVPVEDLVESTNVVALPQGGDPDTVVAVSYGSSGEGGGGGEEIGTFLEIARALNVASPEHDVAFVALGAEESPQLGSALGTRRLIQYLEDEGFAPHVITLEGGPALKASGSLASEIVPGSTQPPGNATDDLFSRSRLQHTTVSGPPEEVGDALLGYLDD